MKWPWTGIIRLGCTLYCSVPFTSAVTTRGIPPLLPLSLSFLSLSCPLPFSSRPCLSPTGTELRGPSCWFASRTCNSMCIRAGI
ncbi:hypothetical protein M440DRAFT_307123 [Trichoderma longibrachiatum ATCC 18648]|uniref:Uncharacterized protein n=1 Tax=Trichoderma longibrachiatum ATCC 18648 TaxID=983965 RepID=A0A2T4C5T8_TRILO|nr:hypothetical protein M440DRAFT_307123 [Trichoderma longibrachiatum ATCC 18648]